MKRSHVGRLTVAILLSIAPCMVRPASAQSTQVAPVPDSVLKRPSTTIPADVQAELDLVYAEYGERKMLLDLFSPAEGQGPFPTILVVHGGGWKNGDKEKFRAMAIALATRGYVTASIGYRLSREAKFPAAIQDCKAAVRWLRATADVHRIDPNRIGAIGGSAGGHLVGLLATSTWATHLEGDGGNSHQSSAIQAAVVLGGGMDLVTPFLEDPELAAGESQLLFFGASYRDHPQIYVDASPITYLDSACPPLLFMDGEYDRPGERYVTTRARCAQLGVETNFILMPEGKHGCWNYEEWFVPMIADMDAFFFRTLR